VLHSLREGLVAELPDSADHIEEVSGRVHDLEADVAAAPPVPLVPVHGDMGHDNVIVDPNGKIHVVDWDDARMSTAEVELAMTAWLAEPVFKSLAAGYVKTLRELDEPVPDLDVAAMELQVWRYNIGCIWFYLERLARPDLPAEQAASDRSLLAWTVSEWETTPAKFVSARDALMATAR
jgi:thiamine kinase-like enzyme